MNREASGAGSPKNLAEEEKAPCQIRFQIHAVVWLDLVNIDKQKEKNCKCHHRLFEQFLLSNFEM